MEQTMPQPIPYLSFNGNCIEAVRVYERVLECDLKALMTYGDLPASDASACGGPPLPERAKHLIMHAYLVMKDGALMAGDCPPGMPYDGMKGVMLAMTYPSIGEATCVFNALAEGGNITMPLAPTFWAKTFGMVTDRFGVSWGINGEEIPV
jgi:PhnB protein